MEQTIEDLLNEYPVLKVEGCSMIAYTAATTCAQTYADQQVALNGEWTEIIDSEDMPLPPFEEKSLILCGDGVQHIGYFNGADTHGYVWFCDDNDYRYPTHWQPLPGLPGSNQGPTKVQLIETIAQLQKDNDELRDKVALHAEELGNQNSYAGMDMENRHDKAMAFLVERITAQKDIAVAMMGDDANQAVIAYNYSIAMITGVTLDDF